jgi:uncharacterized protein (TIGR03089 family)
VQTALANGPDPFADTVPDALGRAVRRRGHAPAVTVLRGATRAEQGVASLAQWAAKGAHLLVDDLGLEAGDTLGIDLPPSWTTAAVCLAAWWAGLVVDPMGEADVVVTHERHQRRGALETFWVGDAVDGGPTDALDGESWTQAVQVLPDAPPPPRAPGGPALRFAGGVASQADLLAEMAALPPGVAGVEVGRTEVRTALLAVTLRPLVAECATVVLDGVDRAAAAGDNVRVWL